LEDRVEHLTEQAATFEPGESFWSSPFGELAFQTQLNDYSQHLCQKNGGATKTWKPEAPPRDWAGA
jgi:hypothetical protein